MFDIQGGDILEDTYQTSEEPVLYISISHIIIYNITDTMTRFYCKVQHLNVSNFIRFHLPIFLRKSFIPVAYELGDDGRVPGSNFENRQREMVSSLMQVFLEESILQTCFNHGYSTYSTNPSLTYPPPRNIGFNTALLRETNG